MRDGNYVVLSVDDDDDIREALKIILESNGYAFAEASSGEEALRIYDDVAPDFILFDLMMEEVDAGATFVKELRARGGELPPIFMLSGVGDNLSMNIDATALGLAGVLQKPINMESLLNILRTKLK